MEILHLLKKGVQKRKNLISLEKITIAIAILGIITSIISITISINANRISKNAYKLSENKFLSDRRIFIKSIKKDDFLELKTITDEQSINKLTIYFPSKFEFQPKVIAPPNLRIYNTQISLTLKKYIDKITPSEKGFSSVLQSFPFPILIISHGSTKGNASITFGVYDLYVSYVRIENNSSTLEIDSVRLNNYANNDINPQKYIDKIFSDYESITYSIQKRGESLE